MMETKEDESEDSRTFEVGRKRDLQESIKDDDIMNVDELSGEDDNSRAKRVKRDIQSSTSDGDDTLNTNVGAISSASVPESSSGLGHAEAQSSVKTVAPMTWNSGIQTGGLRTSFGSKAKRTASLPIATEVAAPKERSIGPEAERSQDPDIQNQAAGPSEEGRPAAVDIQTSGASGEAGPAAVNNSLPFKRLTRKEEKFLKREGPEAWQAYRASKALNISSRVKATKPAEAAPKSVLSEPVNAEDGSSSSGEGEETGNHSGNGKEATTGAPSIPWMISGRFRKLKKEQMSQFSLSERQAYGQALQEYNRKKKEAKFVRNTAQVDNVLSRNPKWPIPEQNVWKLVRDGKTYYPRVAEKAAETFRTFDLPLEILDLHIKGPDFSYEAFVDYHLTRNFRRITQIDNQILRGSFKHYVQNWYSHLPQTMLDEIFEKCKNAAFNLQAARERVTSRVIQQEAAKGEEAPVVNMIDEEEEQAATIEDEPQGPEQDPEIELLQWMYFPGPAGERKPCLFCGKYGHNSPNCPDLHCSCGIIGEHSDLTCPQNERCKKCQQVGHSTQKCPEKLACPLSEYAPCDLCNGSGHTESLCHLLWRSFDPEPEEIRKVRDIPVHCYACGGDGHYGPECGINVRVPLSGVVTWSMENLQRYVDQNSKNRALSAGPDYTIGKGFNIKGKANNPAYIALDDTDDEQDFIRPKVPAPPPQGSIRFNNPNPRKKGSLYPPQANFDDPNYQRQPNPPRYSRPDFSGETFGSDIHPGGYGAGPSDLPLPVRGFGHSGGNGGSGKDSQRGGKGGRGRRRSRATKRDRGGMTRETAPRRR